MIVIEGLTKKFGSNIAVNNLHLQIGKGELFGLLGPNGAGKTTTINVLSTYLSADAGNVTISGFPLPREANKVKRIIGVVPQELSLYNELSAAENLYFWGKLYGMKTADIRHRTNELLTEIDLFNRKDEPIKKFSGGMRRRLNIAVGLIHKPEVLFFDEPTVGVDPQSRNFIFGMIEKLHQEGKTIIYTSHYMEEVERLCTRIGIIDYGKLIAQGTKLELAKLLSFSEWLEIKISDNHPSDFKIPAGAVKTQNILRFDGTEFKEKLGEILDSLIRSGVKIEDVSFKKTNLEEVFLHLTGREFRDNQESK
ncbi:MAG: ABC transporter ATP-binding protein [Candidatus Cloacimonetes bacterium]|nr:ABC transporter ATP-binding protein [Candidatus Cloacimonadota bacterium]